MAKQKDLQHPRTDTQARIDKIEWLIALEKRVANLETRATALEGKKSNGN
jgi:hypothetical protein